MIFFLEVLIIAYFIINSFTGEGINEAVIYHLIYGLDGAGFREYLNLVVLSIVILIVSFVFFYYYDKLYDIFYIDFINKYLNILLHIVILLLLFLSFYFNPLVQYFLNQKYNQEKLEQISFDTVYKKVDVNRSNRTYNLVYIYLESLERTFLDEQIFPKLTPNLKRLEEEGISFKNIHQVKSTGWTIGGMVASQCGLPLVAPLGGGNSMSGVDKFYANAMCLGDILHEQGYFLTMMQGSSIEFSGIKNFYKTHSFDEIYGKKRILKNLYNKKYLNYWGLYDDTLFDIAFEKFKELANKRNNFALFLATLDTHPPKGYESKSCKNYKYLDGNEAMLNAVHCTDMLVNNFIRKIKNSKEGNNTLIVLTSDHLMMNNDVIDLLKKGNRRDLFIILPPNFNNKQIIDKNASILDIGSTVLFKLGFNNCDIGLGRNLFKSNSLLATIPKFNKYIDLWKKDIKKFWGFGKLEDEIIINKESVNINNRIYKTPMLLKIEKDFSINPYFEVDSSNKLYDYLKDFSKDDFFLWVDKYKKINYLSKNKIDVLGETCYIYGKLGSDLVSGILNKSTIINKSSILSYMKKNSSNEIYKNNLSSLEELSEDFTPSWYERVYSRLVRVSKKVKKSFNNYLYNLKKYLKEVYIDSLDFYYSIFKSKDEIIDNRDKFNQDINKTFRLIAHAGGMIDNKTYTDSLDALNKNYDKGFKVFELDIIKTRDNHYVAMHDWNYWQEVTGYKGTLPPTLDEFKKYKIFGKFTPMDMSDINYWFKKHKDTILVTDKVNTPKEFASQFIDKSRLIMELFSWKAVEEAKKLDLKAMPTWNIVKKFNGNILEKIKKLNIKYIAIPISALYIDTKLIKKLSNNGVKLYTFHINYDKDRDEEYTICYHLDKIYGVYADKWNFFDKNLTCSEYIK
jgi:phosphoglycerol transferase